MKKIAIIGYGQMGKLIAQLAPVFGFEVWAKIDPLLGNDLSDPLLKDADVCFEFTNPAVAVDNLKTLINLKKNIVCGTTGWFDNLATIENLVSDNEVGLVYGANFSFGMNLFFQIATETTKIMNLAKEYDVFGLECHQHKKQDSPSGTAKILAEIILKNIDRKSKTQFEKVDGKIAPEELHFASIRAGNIPGTHLIGFDSEADTIEIKHTARNRTGLAIGAIKAANWILNKQGCYNFSDIFTNILES